MKPVSKTKPVTLCGLKKKAETMNITPKQRIKLAQSLLKQAEKRAGIFGSNDGMLGPNEDMFGRNKWDRAGKPTPGKGNLPGGGTSSKGGMGSLLAQLALILGGGVVGGSLGGTLGGKLGRWHKPLQRIIKVEPGRPRVSGPKAEPSTSGWTVNTVKIYDPLVLSKSVTRLDLLVARVPGLLPVMRVVKLLSEVVTI